MDFTEIGVFHGRRPISRKMSRPWNRELSWSLNIMHINRSTKLSTRHQLIINSC